jgi:hypothetical protein
MTLEHLTAARGSSRLIDVEPTALLKTPESPTHHSIPVLRKKSIANTKSASAVSSIDHAGDHKPASAPINKQTSSTGQLYSIIFRIIIMSIQFYHTLKVYYLTAFYFIYEFLIKQKLLNESDDESDKRFQLPKHVCVVLNDQKINTDNEHDISRLYTKIADLLVSFDQGRNQMEALTFYKFEDVSSEIKERVLFDFKSQHERLDKNNNSGNSFSKSEFLDDLNSKEKIKI